MTTATTTAALDIPAIAERYLAAWTAHDVDAIVALHTPDSRFQTHLGGEAVLGRDALREAFAQLFERFPGFDVETHRFLYGDDHWMLDWTLTFQPHGEPRRGFRCLDAVEVALDGLISRKDTFLDFVQFQAATGA